MPLWRWGGLFRSGSEVKQVLGGGEEFGRGYVVPSHCPSGVRGQDGNLIARSRRYGGQPLVLWFCRGFLPMVSLEANVLVGREPFWL